MSSELAVAVDGLGKFYRRPGGTEAVEGASRPWRRPHKGFWALRDLSFSVNEGEIVGIVGRNGAGKSTLLKILSRITRPTAGSATLHGTTASLLEVGSGFHPELTGRENIFLNGSVLGMRRGEIREQFDRIVEFAGVADFLDMPVKRYSSGMYVRLAFAVAAHLTPSVLIVDEVLAVGDAEFQRKCLGRMESVAHGENRTVLFVSHNFAAVSALCDRVILLQDGRLLADGPTNEVLHKYTETLASEGYNRGGAPGYFEVIQRSEKFHSGPPVLRAIQLRSLDGTPTDAVEVGAPLVVDAHLGNIDHFPGMAVGLGIESDFDMRVVALSTRMKPGEIRATGDGGSAVVRFSLAPLPLPPGRYHVGLAVQDGGQRWIESVTKGAPLTVVDNDFYGTGWKMQALPGSIALDFGWEQTSDQTDLGFQGATR